MKKNYNGEFSRISAAFDASPYCSIPVGIAFVRTATEAANLLSECNLSGQPVGFRAAGTSLCGQAVTNGLQISIMKGFGNYSVEGTGSVFRSEPAVRGAIANRVLAKYGMRFPADPASVNYCTIGGITANNSSGMNCGVKWNPYNTIIEAKYVLANGSIIDSCSSSPKSINSVRPDIARSLMQLRERTIANATLTNEIRHKFSIKNTIGLPINAFVDYTKPDDIALHLLTGSEGTLAFVAETAYSVVPLCCARHCGLLIFTCLSAAVASLDLLKAIDGVYALELMDYNSLQSVRGTAGAPFQTIEPQPGSCAVLFEYSADGYEQITSIQSRIVALIPQFDLAMQPIVARSTAEMDAIWRVRNGLLPSLGKSRAKGTAAIIEDVAFPQGNLVGAISQLRQLLDSYGFVQSGIYGHGLDGNVHFIIAQEFATEASRTQYARFNDELSELILRFGGSLKAEHGTGRAMAEFVPKHWSPDAFSLMLDTKHLFDPHGILNPGVIFADNNADTQVGIKSYPVLNSEADNCIECGFCETICPSWNLTLTPRKRIRMLREIAAGGQSGLSEGFVYAGMETCAGDGLCAMNCPVGINTGSIIKHMRAERNGTISKVVAQAISENFSITESVAVVAVRTGNAFSAVIGAERLSRGIGIAEKCLRTALPKPIAEMGLPARIPEMSAIAADFVYFPCCVTRMLGTPKSQTKNIIDTFRSVAAKSGIRLAIPGHISDYCCGMSFQSKGLEKAFSTSANRTIEMLAEASEFGSMPIFFDSSSCAYTVKNCREVLSGANKLLFDRLTILDSVEFLSAYVLPRVSIRHQIPCAVLHNTCSQTKMQLDSALRAIAEQCAQTVVVPEDNGCCGFAGDRGFLFPELTESATCAEAKEVRSIGEAEYYSSNLPCEMGMSHATGREYLPIAYLVDKVSI